MRRTLTWTALALMVAALAGCGGDGLPSVTTRPGGSTPDTTLPDSTTPESTSPETTQPDTTTPETTAPETTQPSDTTTTTSGAGDEPGEEDGSIPLWVWILGAVAMIAFFSWLGARSRRRPAPPAPPLMPAGATALARQAYADSRWLYDNLTPAMAQWKGDEQHRAQTGGAVSGDPRQSVWWESQTRLENARNALYQVEASAPTGPTGLAARAVLDALAGTKTAFDDMAAAATARAGGAAPPDGSLETLRAAETAASDRLAWERSRLQQAIAGLASVIEAG